MKKIVFLIVLLLVAGVIFAQNYTFQDLPWGSTKEQVIAKLGEPDSVNNSNSAMAIINLRLIYHVTLNGYNTRLDIRFHDNKMYDAFYYINRQPFRYLSEIQVNVAFLALFKQLTDKYGAFHEVYTDKNDSELQYWVWHFNNFHIGISSITLNAFEIGYFSTASWKIQEDWASKMNRLPNREL